MFDFQTEFLSDGRRFEKGTAIGDRRGWGRLCGDAVRLVRDLIGLVASTLQSSIEYPRSYKSPRPGTRPHYVRYRPRADIRLSTRCTAALNHFPGGRSAECMLTPMGARRAYGPVSSLLGTVDCNELPPELCERSARSIATLSRCRDRKGWRPTSTISLYSSRKTHKKKAPNRGLKGFERLAVRSRA